MVLIPFHVLGGAIGIVTGLVALYAIKGGRLHRRSGTIFAYAMLVMSLSGVVLAFGRPGTLVNIPAGLVTGYLVVTGLLTVSAPSARVQQAERAAMNAAFVFVAIAILSAIVSATRGNRAIAMPLVIFGAIALGAALGDRRMLRMGGLRGSARLKRHLWRMSVALFVATASFFTGPVRRIPEPLRIPVLRLIPLAVLVTMAYWLWRVRRRPPVSQTSHASLHTA